MLERLKMAGKLKINLLIILCSLSGGAVGVWLVGKLTSTDESLNAAQLAATVSSINATLPMDVDAETVLISTASAQNTFTYNYELISHFKAEIDTLIFKQIMAPVIIDAVCTRGVMKPFRDMGILVRYRYFDENKIEIATITVDTTHCGLAI